MDDSRKITLIIRVLSQQGGTITAVSAAMLALIDLIPDKTNARDAIVARLEWTHSRSLAESVDEPFLQSFETARTAILRAVEHGEVAGSQEV